MHYSFYKSNWNFDDYIIFKNIKLLNLTWDIFQLLKSALIMKGK